MKLTMNYDSIDPIDNDNLRYRLLHDETIPELARRYGSTEGYRLGCQVYTKEPVTVELSPITEQ
jgi:hypothetical protein